MSTMFPGPRMNRKSLALALIAPLALSGVVSTASAAPTESTTHIAPIQARVPTGFPAVSVQGTCSNASIKARANLKRVKKPKKSVLIDVRISGLSTPKEYWVEYIQNDQTSSHPAAWAQAHNSSDSKVHFTTVVKPSDRNDFFDIQLQNSGGDTCTFVKIPTP